MQTNFAKIRVLFTRNIAEISGEKVWFFGRNFEENSLSHTKVRTHARKFANQTAKFRWDFVCTETKIQEISLSHTKVLTHARTFATRTTIFRWQFVCTEIKTQEPKCIHCRSKNRNPETTLRKMLVTGSYFSSMNEWNRQLYTWLFECKHDPNETVDKHLRAISTACSFYSSCSLFTEIHQHNPLTVLILIITNHTSKIQCSCFFLSRQVRYPHWD